MYTFFNNYLSLLEQKDKNMAEIKIPYIGRIMLRFKEGEPDLEPFILLDSNVKDIIKNLRTGNDTGMVQFFQENFINKVVNNIVDE